MNITPQWGAAVEEWGGAGGGSGAWQVHGQRPCVQGQRTRDGENAPCPWEQGAYVTVGGETH